MACSIDVLTNHGASGAKAKHGKLPGRNWCTSCAGIMGKGDRVLRTMAALAGRGPEGDAGVSPCLWYDGVRRRLRCPASTELRPRVGMELLHPCRPS